MRSGPTTRRARWIPVLAAAVMALGGSTAGAAIAADGTLPTLSRWLGPADLGQATLAEAPREMLHGEDAPLSFLAEFGRLAFRAPTTLGGRARQLDLSCQTCHPNGDAGTAFFFATTNDRPGNVDVSHRFWNGRADNGRFDPVNIPSLRGVAASGPFGHDGRFGSLRAFVRNVIVVEFSGREPRPALLDALTAYLQALAPAENALLGPRGRLTGAAPAAARAGAAPFERACAACHVPDAGFRDGLAHDVGTGGYRDTPGLRGLAGTAPYLADGSAADLATLLDRHADALDLALGQAEKAAILAYLAAIGAVDRPRQAITLAADMADIEGFVGLLHETMRVEDADLTGLIADMVRGELGRVAERFRAPAANEAQKTAESALGELAERLRRLEERATARDFPAARRLRDALSVDIAAFAEAHATALPGSLYDPEALAAAFSR
ncbi:hypothetical protein [Oceanibacterium hippocampi]|uniref:Di-heme cytochrome c peroxidase n=1 Tax=Oceanibacterium hippocampi TaxID=745714 RepID=A0A1Y5S5U3_9PROT|nr:hypothetical protein [Oceanibacterium hippocampi]SLN33206.1 Di-heme cytochrome c peroxidase [Oceanibacterium hippocampi]